ncbi:MAG: glycosyltransferase family 2 protein [Acidimicrobiales bacterium]|jgi:glycosyltransferase involved in cell wall biosynthesis|nr:glycosyltransferase family 2 protein [Acidimicrobiales bacterium]MDP6299069.1 glycosyltransferase family 2 protein [Acidimicrobiales bacterium]HJM28161.1 dolichyl-phosphate beta-glucosyltransferase [Acidimicrobiales bacterium]HJM97516.1 dolichyl-phosphate beta-glucosyltransferase [Acidimicrobiales bacterium]
MRQNEYIFNSSAKLSIVLPAFNEERRLPPLLDALCAINHDPKDIELIVVDDGSTDGTSLICQQIINDFFPNGKVITKPKNTGKGSALRTGVAAANAPIIITMDADMATDLSAMEPAIKGLQTHHIVVGSRSIEGSQTQGITSTRRFVTIGFSFLLRLLTRHRISDTQCGFKAYKSPVAKILFSSSRVKGFAQDAEILDLAYRHNFSILEIPVRWTSIPGSKVNLIRDSISSFLEFIRYRLSTGKTKRIDGLSILDNESEEGIVESEILRFFPPGNIYIRCQSTTDIMMPEVGRDEIKKIAKAFHRKYPDWETCICSRTLSDLSSIKY